jgi:hypothetical protein
VRADRGPSGVRDENINLYAQARWASETLTGAWRVEAGKYLLVFKRVETTPIPSWHDECLQESWRTASREEEIAELDRREPEMPGCAASMNSWSASGTDTAGIL